MYGCHSRRTVLYSMALCYCANSRLDWHDILYCTVPEHSRSRWPILTQGRIIGDLQAMRARLLYGAHRQYLVSSLYQRSSLTTLRARASYLACRSAQLSSMADSKIYRYVVLGCGNAAGYAAREFVTCGAAPGEVALVGDEPALPYERPALSKAFLTNSAVRLPGFHTCVGGGGERQNQDWYDEKGVATLTGSRVVGVDFATKELSLESGGKVVASEALILATGADPIRLDKMPGGTLDNVLYLRNNADGLVMAEKLQANVGKDVLVVGGGYIGMEVAAAAATVGCKVTMVFPEEHIMPRLFTPAIAEYYEKVFTDLGVKMLNKGRVCKAFLDNGSGAVRGALICKDSEEEELEASLVVVGVGARAATSLFGALEGDGRGGVVVDSSMKTSVSGVYAIGDIATFPLKMYGGRPARVEHVGHARSSAAHAVRAICGKEPGEYDYLPFFYSRFASVSWKFYGDSAGESVVVGDFNPKLAAFWVEDGKVVGVFCEKPEDDDDAVMKKIAIEKPAASIEKIKAAGGVDAVFTLFK